jgi:fatty-acid desaturase
LRWWQIDLNYRFIWLLEKLGLATDVKRARFERRAEREPATVNGS